MSSSIWKHRISRCFFILWINWKSNSTVFGLQVGWGRIYHCQVLKSWTVVCGLVAVFILTVIWVSCSTQPPYFQLECFIMTTAMGKIHQNDLECSRKDFHSTFPVLMSWIFSRGIVTLRTLIDNRLLQVMLVCHGLGAFCAGKVKLQITLLPFSIFSVWLQLLKWWWEGCFVCTSEQACHRVAGVALVAVMMWR